MFFKATTFRKKLFSNKNVDMCVASKIQNPKACAKVFYIFCTKMKGNVKVALLENVKNILLWKYCQSKIEKFGCIEIEAMNCVCVRMYATLAVSSKTDWRLFSLKNKIKLALTSLTYLLTYLLTYQVYLSTSSFSSFLLKMNLAMNGGANCRRRL